MARSVSGQDESNPALWLATQTGKIELSCPLGTTRRVPREKFPKEPYNKSFIDQAYSVKMAGYWPRSFFASLWTQKRIWPYPAILTEKTSSIIHPYRHWLIDVFILLLTGSVYTPGCPPGWHRSPDGTRCFGLLFERKNWTAARQACKSHGADLASFHSRYGFKINYKPRKRQCFLWFYRWNEILVYILGNNRSVSLTTYMVFMKGLEPGKMAACENDFAHLVWLCTGKLFMQRNSAQEVLCVCQN